MANQKPDEDDFLDDLNLDDVDFDSLLDDDTRQPASSGEKKTGAPADAADDAAPPAAPAKDETVDLDLDDDTELSGFLDESEPTAGDGGVAGDGDDDDIDVASLLDDDDGDDEIDISAVLGDDDDTSAASEAPAADASDVEELGEDDILGEDDLLADEEDETTDIESLLGDDLDTDDSDDDAVDLLGDDDTAADDDDAASFLDDDDTAADDDAVEAAVAAGAAAGVAAAAAASDEDDAPAKGSRKGKIGKKGIGKGKGKSIGSKAPKGKGPKGKGGGAKKAGRSKPAPARKPRPAPAPKAGGALRFICSECYAEFHLPRSFSSETLTCPECLHVGKRPNEEFLHTVQIHKSGERKSFATAVAAGVALLGVLLFLVWLVSPFCTLEVATKPDELKTWTLALLGGGGVLTIVFLWLAARFEKNRWDVYF